MDPLTLKVVGVILTSILYTAFGGKIEPEKPIEHFAQNDRELQRPSVDSNRSTAAKCTVDFDFEIRNDIATKSW